MPLYIADREPTQCLCFINIFRIFLLDLDYSVVCMLACQRVNPEVLHAVLDRTIQWRIFPIVKTKI